MDLLDAVRQKWWKGRQMKIEGESIVLWVVVAVIVVLTGICGVMIYELLHG